MADADVVIFEEGEGRRIAEAVSRARAPEPPWFFAVREGGPALLRADGAELLLRVGRYPAALAGRHVAIAVFPSGAEPFDAASGRYVRCQATARPGRLDREIVRAGGVLDRYLPLFADACRRRDRAAREARACVERIERWGARPLDWPGRQEHRAVLDTGDGGSVTFTVHPNGTVYLHHGTVSVEVFDRWARSVERKP